MKVVLPRK
jgi:hypothetical protein